MDCVIPQEVLDHIRELADRESSLEGLFTRRQMEDELGVSAKKARDLIRLMLRDGHIRSRRVAISDEQAIELGYLGGTGLRCYEFVQT